MNLLQHILQLWLSFFYFWHRTESAQSPLLQKCRYFCSSTDCKYFSHIFVQGEKWALCFISVCTLCPAADKRLWAPWPQLCRLAMIVLLLLLQFFQRGPLLLAVLALCLVDLSDAGWASSQLRSHVAASCQKAVTDDVKSPAGICHNTHILFDGSTAPTLWIACVADDSHVRRGGSGTILWRWTFSHQLFCFLVFLVPPSRGNNPGHRDFTRLFCWGFLSVLTANLSLASVSGHLLLWHRSQWLRHCLYNFP